MIKYLKFLWKKCFGGMGNSRTKKSVVAVKHTPTASPILIVESEPIQPESFHCANHTRFKKSCPACAEVTK